MGEITLTIDTVTADNLLRQWEDEAVNLDGQLTELRQRIASLRSQLNGAYPAGALPVVRAQPPQARAVAEGQASHATETQKRRKGENLRAVKAYLGSAGIEGATVAAIRAGTGISASSIQAVLRRHAGEFRKNQTGLWSVVKM